MRSAGNFLVGAVIGGLVGAALGLLFAPTSGSELQAQIQERANQVQADMKEAASSKRAELESQLNAMRAPKEAVVVEETTIVDEKV
jgi:gas vesicle protein